MGAGLKMNSTIRLSVVIALTSAACLPGGCTSIDKGGGERQARSEVIVMGMIHGGHRANPKYSIEEIKRLVRLIDPDFILTEIPPDRFETALEGFRKTGEVTEPRVRVFPEYVDAIFPLTREMDFQIIPCAGWTRAMADDRRDKLQKWAETRKAESEEVNAAQQWATDTIEAQGLADDPLKIHTDRYDEIVRKGMEPYNRLFNDDLGLGGWDNINAAHMAHIHEALDAHQGEGKRFLITFGAWHKYWFIEDLKERDDIVLRNLVEFISP